MRLEDRPRNLTQVEHDDDGSGGSRPRRHGGAARTHGSTRHASGIRKFLELCENS